MFKRHHIFIGVLGFIAVLAAVMIPINGTSSLEMLVCLAVIVACGWLGWHLFNDGKLLEVQLESLRNDYKAQHDKATECVRETKDLRLSVQLLKRQKRNTEAIIYSISDAVIVTDANDRLLMANEPAGALFGFDINKVFR